MAQPQRCILSQEIELKLVLPSDEAEAFLKAGLVVGQPTKQKLHAVYFDTPDHALLAADLSLRIRRSGRKRIQTIKHGDSKTMGLFARQEWEKAVSGDLPVLDQSTPVAALLREAIHELAPAFEVKVERLTWLLDEEDASIELVLDRGTVSGTDRLSPICELELELKQGEPGAIFALARRIADATPVRPGVVSKSERGYELLGPAQGAFKADKVKLQEEISSADAYQIICGLCLRQYRRNEDLLLVARDPEALHQARVALRRMRSAIAIFEPMLDSAAVNHFQAELRWLTAILGDARDLDVLLGKADAGALQDRLQEACKNAYSGVGSALESKRARALLLDLTEWLAVGAWLDAPDTQDLRNTPARDFAQKALHKLRQRVKRRGSSLAQLSDEERHKVRKAAKRLRYGAEFFASLFASGKDKRRGRKFVASLEALQDDLGELNDLVAAPLVLREAGLEGEQGTGDLLTHRRKARIVETSQEAMAKLMDRKVFWS